MLTPAEWIASPQHRGEGWTPTPEQTAAFCSLVDRRHFAVLGDARGGKSRLLMLAAAYELYRISTGWRRGGLADDAGLVVWAADTEPEARRYVDAFLRFVAAVPYFRYLDADAAARLFGLVSASSRGLSGVPRDRVGLLLCVSFALTEALFGGPSNQSVLIELSVPGVMMSAPDAPMLAFSPQTGRGLAGLAAREV